MKRIAPLLAALLALSLLTPAAVAADTPEECEGEVGNATVDALCDRVAELEETNDNLSDENVELERDIVELESELENTGGIPEADMKRIGAWHPDKNESAVFVVREQDPNEENPNEQYGVFYYVGPDNGDVNFHGRNAWAELPMEELDDSQFPALRVELPYAPSGIETTHEFQNSEAPEELRRIESEMNNRAEEAVFAWADWNNDQRQSAENWSTLGLVGGLGVIVVVGYGTARLEAGTGLLSRRQQKKKRDKVTRQAAGTEKQSLITRIRGWFGR